jgi:hypothetical protein
VKAYQVTIPGFKAFTYITDTPLADLPAAIQERFRCEPITIKAL